MKNFINVKIVHQGFLKNKIKFSTSILNVSSRHTPIRVLMARISDQSCRTTGLH